jgi:hypothetical protein
VLRPLLAPPRRHSPVIPTAVEGSLFQLEILFPQFFSTPTATQTHPTLPAEGGAKDEAPAKAGAGIGRRVEWCEFARECRELWNHECKSRERVGQLPDL